MTPSPPAQTIVFRTLMNHQSSLEHVAWLTMGCRPCWSTSAMGPLAGERAAMQGVSLCPPLSPGSGLQPAGDRVYGRPRKPSVCPSLGWLKSLSHTQSLGDYEPLVWSLNFSSPFCFTVRRIEPRPLSRLGKHPTTEPSFNFLFCGRGSLCCPGWSPIHSVLRQVDL